MATDAAPRYTLFIGNKNYSSWSLRAWALLKVRGIPFVEERLSLYVDGSRDLLLARSPSGKVPCLRDGEGSDAIAVWYSLAICEYAAEQHRGLWPDDRAARAWSRSACAEMHSGFPDLRNEFGMNVRMRLPRTPSPAVAGDIARIVSLWNEGRQRFGGGGEFLCGEFSIVDAFYCPVAFRFQTYAVSPEGAAGDYLRALLALPAMQDWAAASAAETETIPMYDPPEVDVQP
jgi:glutathione S-transferase